MSHNVRTMSLLGWVFCISYIGLHYQAMNLYTSVVGFIHFRHVVERAQTILDPQGLYCIYSTFISINIALR